MNTALRNKQLYDPVTKITAEKLQKFVLKKGVKETLSVQFSEEQLIVLHTPVSAILDLH